MLNKEEILLIKKAAQTTERRFINDDIHKVFALHHTTVFKSGFFSVIPFNLYCRDILPLFPRDILPFSFSLWFAYAYKDPSFSFKIYCKEVLEVIPKVFTKDQINFGTLFAEAGSIKGERILSKRFLFYKKSRSNRLVYYTPLKKYIGDLLSIVES